MIERFRNELNLRQEIIQSILIFFGGAIFQELMIEWGIANILEIKWERFFIGGFFWLLLWKGNSYLVIVIDSTGITWRNQPALRLVISLAVTIAYVVVAVLLIYFVYIVLLLGYPLEELSSQLNYGTFKLSLIITLVISGFMHGRAFLIDWRQALIAAEKYKNESLTAKYESLKNQVNPHFLFNSLNALSSLVYDDQAKAVEFIRKLSQVYRYVLDKKDLELVPLEDELEFLKNYLFLQQIRFGDSLKLNLSIDSNEGMIPPIALQILLENAVKHNIVSESKPLTVDIEVKNSYCTIKNNIQEKLNKDSTGIGLSNLKSRYDFLTDKKVEISQVDNQFIVKIPVLEMK